MRRMGLSLLSAARGPLNWCPAISFQSEVNSVPSAASPLNFEKEINSPRVPDLLQQSVPLCPFPGHAVQGHGCLSDIKKSNIQAIWTMLFATPPDTGKSVATKKVITIKLFPGVLLASLSKKLSSEMPLVLVTVIKYCAVLWVTLNHGCFVHQE